VSRIYHLSENDNIPPHVSSEFARGDFKTLKLQLAAAMPPAARKHTIVKDNNHVVLEVFSILGMFGLKGPQNPYRVLLCPLGLTLGV
jgi:hypothetical protein